MNTIIPDAYDEGLHRLALGLELIDAARQGRIARPIRATRDGTPRPASRTRPWWRDDPRFAADGLRRIDRHNSSLFTLLFTPGVKDRVAVRLDDPGRRFVPRRLAIPIPTEAGADARPYTDRVRRPALFPGAAYDVSESATGLRGRVVRDNRPMRWARVEARTAGANGVVVGRAHGDDRGEFLLLLGTSPAVAGTPIAVTVYGPAAAPAPATPDLPGLDPLWDLPLEVVPAPDDPGGDRVSTGEALPAGYVAGPSRTVPLPLGAIRSETAPFVFA
jgi:hypothetical protein